jgi:gamma-glutamyltranspeptidase/glutathione hydrolase
MMTILLIHTGGTIAMVAGPAGLVPQEGLLESQVAQMGHKVVTPPDALGGAQNILMQDSGVLIGASDPRKDGCALGY